MRLATVHSATLQEADRIDAGYHLSPGIQALVRLEHARSLGTPVSPLGGADGVAAASQPGRFRRQYAAPGETSVPYLKPYDIFDYLPAASETLSLRRSENLEDLVVGPDTLLMTCSGRNLGPVVAADAYLRRFALSHDVIRLSIPDEETRWVVLTFLNSTVGQEIIRRDKSGSVIDHISVRDVERISVPVLDGLTRLAVASLARAAVTARERARMILDHSVGVFAGSLPPVPAARPAGGWEVRTSDLRERLDAAPYDPAAAAWIARTPDTTTLGEVAVVEKPASRYKAYHVGPEQGQPFLAGGQTGQWSVVDPGWLFAVVASPAVQTQIQNLARGSVVDSLYVHDVEDVVVPAYTESVVGADVSEAWELFAAATSLDAKAVALMDSTLVGEGVDRSGSWSELTASEAVLVRISDGRSGSPVATPTKGETVALVDLLGADTGHEAAQPLPEGLVGVVTQRFANSVLASVDAQDHSQPVEVELGLDRFRSTPFREVLSGYAFDWVTTDGGPSAEPRRQLTDGDRSTAEAWTREALGFLGISVDGHAPRD